MEIYNKLLELKVFSFNDLMVIFKNKNAVNQVIYRMLHKGYIIKIKYNLYAVINIVTKSVIPDEYMIASKITKTSYVSYHSSMDYYGKKNQVFYYIYVSSDSKFKDFEFNGMLYKYVKSKINVGIDNKNNVKVTDIERTVIDCINNIDLAGGQEELFKCLDLVGKLNNDKLIKYLKAYNQKKLYKKVGFIFEKYKIQFDISDKLLTLCLDTKTTTKYYFDKETKNIDNKYINKWNLIVPYHISYKLINIDKYKLHRIYK
jgi:predicted transcriptional regulator of viral defense system